MNDTRIQPQKVLHSLLDGAGTRKRKTLLLLNNILKSHHEKKSQDFSIATIGRLSGELGGPSSQSIRNKMGADYRQLIQVWAEFSGAQMKKPPKQQTDNSNEFAILERIADPAIRAVVASVIAERNILRKENRILKNTTEVIIDKRSETRSSFNVELLPANENVLSDMEKEALIHAISEQTLENMGWTTDDSGRIKAGRSHIYKAGYVAAIKKALKIVNS